MIRLNNVSKHFGTKIAVNNLSLQIAPGEIFAFLGPNGAGKTTTIKMLVGLLQPTSGTIEVCGLPMDTDALTIKRLLAYVPDQPYLYDKLTGREQLEFVGRMYGMTSEQIHQRLQYLIELFNLGDYIDALCENYSHGMKQRIVFSAAMIHSPRVLIIDEPMVGLDPRSIRIVKNVLKEQSANQVSVLMSTHSLGVAEETATRIGIIRQGELVVEGSLQQLQEKSQVSGRLEEIFLELTED